MSITIELNTWAIIILLVIGVVEFAFRPHLDKTEDGVILLWYGKRKRKYFVLKK